MTLRGKLVALFPILHVALIGIMGCLFVRTPGLIEGILVLNSLYLFPILIFRLHEVFSPLSEGASRFDAPSYSGWWTSHQLQGLYNALPLLESLLRLVPGAYSLWLRLWGSKIGKNVHWTALVEVLDRSLLDVGDNVVFGHKTICACHTLARRNLRTYLYVKKIVIKDNVFIGGLSNLGPGTVIPEGTNAPVFSVFKGDRQTVPLNPQHTSTPHEHPQT